MLARNAGSATALEPSVTLGGAVVIAAAVGAAGALSASAKRQVAAADGDATAPSVGGDDAHA